MYTFSGVSYQACETPLKSAARQSSYVSDTIDLIDYLNEIDPFVQHDSLFNIENGVTTQQKLLEFMAGKYFVDAEVSIYYLTHIMKSVAVLSPDVTISRSALSTRCTYSNQYFVDAEVSIYYLTHIVKSAAGVFTDRLRKSIQLDFSTI